MIKHILTFSLFFQLIAFGQCVVNSTNGYSVKTSICPSQVIVSTTNCPWGYNYNIRFDYDIAFEGVNQPSNLFTLQTEINCNGQINGFYALPLSGGTGTATTVTNPAINHTGSAYSYGSNPSCTQANLNNLQCNSLNLIIQGPGIPYQVVNCNCLAIALPVAFVAMDYQLEGNKVALDWTVESETNNDYYTLLKSVDGKDWEVIQQVKSKENLSSTYTYETTIDNDGIGNYYVKLVQTDKDGRYNELGMVYVENELPALVVAPNPMTENTIHLYLQKVNKEAVVRFVHLSGSEIKKSVVYFDNGIATCESPEENGCYFLEVIQNEQIISRQKVFRVGK